MEIEGAGRQKNLIYSILYNPTLFETPAVAIHLLRVDY